MFIFFFTCNFPVAWSVNSIIDAISVSCINAPKLAKYI